jgi:hypothetical protein
MKVTILYLPERVCIMMSASTKAEYPAAIKTRYQGASRSEKGVFVDEFCRVCGYNRKYVNRLLTATERQLNQQNLSKQGRKKHYDHP